MNRQTLGVSVTLSEHMPRNTLIGLAVLIALVGAFLWYFGGNSPITPLPPTGSYALTEDRYEITAQYATSTPLTSPHNEEAVSLMYEFVTETISAFKALERSPEDPPHSLQILYLTAISPRTISYIYTVYEETGGAHGMSYFNTFMFDTVTGEHLSLEDLFRPGSAYLETLSSLAREKLPSVIGEYADEEMIASGTEPAEESFSQFFIGGSTLFILFPPYQVAAYAQGPVTLQLPLSELETMRSEYK